jgi:NADH:ubiquinone oxidoreductase subunit C
MKDFKDYFAELGKKGFDITVVSNNLLLLSRPDQVSGFFKRLKNDLSPCFDFLKCLTAFDEPEENRICLVYIAGSYRENIEIEIRTYIGRNSGILPSVSAIYPTAEWFEREIYDLFGVSFSNHPDLRRILCPENFTGHPLLKDYSRQDFMIPFPTGGR